MAYDNYFLSFIKVCDKLIFTCNKMLRGGKSLSFLFLIIFFFTGCSGGIRIDRYKGFAENHDHFKEMISIDPDFDLLPIEQQQNQNYIKVNERLKTSNLAFNKLIAATGRKLGIKITVKDGRELNRLDSDYFKDLAPLKQQIMQAGLLQIFGVANKTSDTDIILSGRQANDWETSPQLPVRFSQLEQKYGTRFFGVQGIRFYKKGSPINFVNLISAPPAVVLDLLDKDYEIFYYSIIADVVESRIVSREYRKLDMKNNVSDLESIIYDSFELMLRK